MTLVSSGDLRQDAQRSVNWRRLVATGAVLLGLLYGAATIGRMYARKYYIFLGDYIRWSPAVATDRPIHVFFLFADHFEPSYDEARVRRWSRRYRALAARHHDSDGRPPQHTWFYPGEQSDPGIMTVLHDLTRDGLGEVQLHHHHRFESEQTLRVKLTAAIAEFQRVGFLRTLDGQTRFAFVHGNSGLDNSNGLALCGVNTELRLLHSLGAFGDFTFPSIYLDSQPPSVNSIYAAKDDDAPKSYARRLPLSTLSDGSADLMIFQGPLVFALTWNPAHLFFGLFVDLSTGTWVTSPVLATVNEGLPVTF